MSQVKKILFALLSVIILQPEIFTQVNREGVNREWVNRYNGSANRFDIVCSMKLDSASNVYVCGYSSETASAADIVLVKYGQAGDILWNAHFNGYGNSIDQPYAFYLDKYGNSYITGFTSDTNLQIKIVTLKYNSSGSLLWNKTYEPSSSYRQGIGYGIVTDAAGNVYTAGSITKQNGKFDIVLLKYSPQGILTDSVIYTQGILSSQSPVSVCLDAQETNIVVMGSVELLGEQAKILTVKFNAGLEPVWQKILTGTYGGGDFPVQMIRSNDNKLIVCGAVNNNTTGLDYCVYRLDTNSAMLTQYSFNGSGNNRDIPYAVMEDAANNIYVTGSSRNADTLGSEDIVTLKLSQTGLLQWSRSYNGIGTGIDYGTAIAADISGNIYVGGATDKGNNHVEYALLKYNSSGELSWIERYSKIVNSEDFVYTVEADNSRNVFVTGISFDSLSDYDIATIKYSQPIGITQISAETPREFVLYPNYPNPFNPVTKIKFTVPWVSTAVNIKLSVYDITGKEVDMLIDGELSPGIYEYEFDAADHPSGVYFYRLSSAKLNITHKMILLK